MRQVLRKDVDCAYLDESKPVRIFKIHGDFVNQDFVVITSQDYKDFFRQNPNPQMWGIVKREFLTKHILFIGYSLADSNIIDIIKNISKSVNRNQKDMFLIAPGLNKSRQTQLKKMKVHYYDALAADFFTAILAELKKTIVKDFRHHKVSPETFSTFCHLHNIDPTISIKEEKDNEIVNYRPLDGKGLRHEINMTIDNERKEMFESGDFERYGVIVKDSPLPNVPYMIFSGKDLLSCSHTVNNIVINDEFKAVLVGPKIDDLPITIRIPSKKFFEKVVAKKYCPRKDKAVINFDCNIYQTEIVVEAINKSVQGTDFRFKFNFTFKDKYTDNNAAIKWIEFISAFFAGEEILINEIFGEPFNTSKLIDSHDDKYKEYRRYYENVKQIEMISGVNFSIYNCFDEKNYIASCIISAYLTQSPLFYACPNGFKFSTEAITVPNFLKEDEDSSISIVMTENDNQEYILNGKKFTIPYTFIILNSCYVDQIIQKDNGLMDICFQYKQVNYAKCFSDKPVAEMYPSLTLLESNNVKEVK